MISMKLFKSNLFMIFKKNYLLLVVNLLLLSLIILSVYINNNNSLVESLISNLFFPELNNVLALIIFLTHCLNFFIFISQITVFSDLSNFKEWFFRFDSIRKAKVVTYKLSYLYISLFVFFDCTLISFILLIFNVNISKFIPVFLAYLMMGFLFFNTIKLESNKLLFLSPVILLISFIVLPIILKNMFSVIVVYFVLLCITSYKSIINAN